VVNTRFCCLCTLDADHSFYPRWRPPFVSALAPEDRCHLNGLAMVDGRPSTSPHWAKPIRLRVGAPTKPRAACSSTWKRMESCSADYPCRTRRAGIEASYGCSNPARAAWRKSILSAGPGAPSRSFPALPGHRLYRTAGLHRTLAGARERRLQRHSVGRERARTRLRRLGCQHRYRSDCRLPALRGRRARIFAVQILHGMRFPELLEWNDAQLGNSYVLPVEALAEVPLVPRIWNRKLPTIES